ncbi:MAG: DUF1275 domain-containing protein [Catenulispora sp.]|nr:DUF1275 domain-containing protein [Catenulispora sp.]
MPTIRSEAPSADMNPGPAHSGGTRESDQNSDAELRRAAHARLRDRLVVALAFVTGATDAIGFVSLGGVFTSVMTGNMVLLGMGVGRGKLALLEHTGVALAAFITGTILGARVAQAPQPNDPIWPRRLTLALLAEFALFLAAALCWWTVGSHPHGTIQSLLLATDALALGLQSSAVLRLNVSGLSTTYLTGTLTTLIQSRTTKRHTAADVRSAFLLLALITGAALGTALALHCPAAAPLVALVVLPVVIVGAELGMRG